MTIAFPRMGDYQIPAYYLLSHIFKDVKIIKAPKITNKTVELGSKVSPEFVCTPFKYTLGTMMECVEMGADTLVQMGGGCRYGYYAELQEKILGVRVINLVTEGKANIFRINRLLKEIGKYSKIKAIYYGFITMKMIKYMDEIDKYIRSNIGFEVNKNEFENLKEEMLEKFSKVNSYFELHKLYKSYFKKFKQIKINKPLKPLRIGIIGELYTIMEPFSNYFLEKELAKKHIEIKRFTNVHYLLFEKKKKFKEFKKYASRYFTYSMGADASDNIARSLWLCKNDYDGIIHIKSSFCTPEISCMSIINKICNEYNKPVLFFSFDTNTSEVGIQTRLEAFYDMLEMRGK